MATQLSQKTITFPRKIINHYVATLARDIKLDGVLLFGSFAYGSPTKHSDVDLAVVSPDFNNMAFGKRMDWLEKKRDKLTDAIAMDIIGYTPREFRYIDKESAIMAEAKKKGRWLYKK